MVKKYTRFVRFCSFAFVWLVLLTSCTSVPDFEKVYTVVAPATLLPGAAIPLPSAVPILTVTGKIGAANSADAILMDLATIEQVGLVEYTVADPFEEDDILYRGVLMRDLLALWQVPADATVARVTALNDYMVDIPINDFRQYPVLFALQSNGVYMQPDYRGPAMLVYPINQYNLDLIAVQRNWVWQISTIDIQ